MNNDRESPIETYFKQGHGDGGRMEINPAHTLMKHLTSTEDGNVMLDADLDPGSEPFLHDHTMNGLALFPGVMGIEGFCAAAEIAAAQIYRDAEMWHVTQVEDVHFNMPIKFYKNNARRVQWVVTISPEGDRLEAQVRLEASMPRYGQPGEMIEHFSGKVILERGNDADETHEIDIPESVLESPSLRADEIYRLYFHGPAFQVIDSVQRLEDGILAKFNTRLPALTAEQCSLISSPCLLELCLQAAGVYEIGREGLLALPSAIGRIKAWQGVPGNGEFYAKVTSRAGEDQRMHHDAWVFEPTGRLVLKIDDYQTQSLPYELEAQKLAAIRNWFTQTR